MTLLKKFSRIVSLVKTSALTDNIIRTTSIEHPAYVRLSDQMIKLLYSRGEQELERISGINLPPSSPGKEPCNGLR
jgi:hypothetical protein